MRCVERSGAGAAVDLVVIGSRVWILDAAVIEMVEKAESFVWKMN
jgi:hypothetical protein